MRLIRRIQRRGQIADLFAHALERRQLEAAGDQFEDRGRVVGGLVDKAAPGEGRGDDRGDPRSRTKAVAPPRPVRRNS
jgi:hypothetical protein